MQDKRFAFKLRYPRSNSGSRSRSGTGSGITAVRAGREECKANHRGKREKEKVFFVVHFENSFWTGVFNPGFE